MGSVASIHHTQVERTPSRAMPRKVRKTPALSAQAPGQAAAKRLETPRLEDVLAYKNPEVVARFLDSYPIDPADAEDLFTETKRWLWLSMLERGRRPWLAVTYSMFAIDEMWHTFLMFTRDYAEFCFRFFGEYIHHQPTHRREQRRAERLAQKDPEAFARSFRRKMERQYRYVARHLGEETLRKWYIEIADKYSTDKLRRLQAEKLLKEHSSAP